MPKPSGRGAADSSYAAGTGIAGRGVLLDVGRYKGSDGPDDSWLPLDANPLEEAEPDAAITLDDLKATADAQGVRLREHDILLIRTGAIERTQDPNAEWDPFGEPGLTYSDDLIEWVHEMDIPYIGADNLAVEQIFQTVTEDDLGEGRKSLHGNYALPLHGAFLRDLGVSLNEVLDLSELAAQCAEDGIYEFLFTAAPLNFEMGTGGPVNPVVLKATDGAGEEGGSEGRRGRGR
ncbi:cyclase family protein [Natronomonas sp.]|uniref:cyclase family protein n=1 Tax=Natronomonas sp. TaxID=2184060 RepID=UPI002FC39822